MRKIALLLLALTATACGTSDPCAKDPALCLDGGYPGACSGQCADGITYPWSPPWLLWLGPEGSALPTCPATATNSAPGYADVPPATVECPPCACSPTESVCYLSTMITANKAACPGSASEAMPFDAPTTWDGTCTAMDAIPSAASLETPPPQLASQLEDGCSASDDPPITLAGGKTRALTCSSTYGLGEAPGTCASASATCSLANVAGFSTCIASAGDVACPDGWPNKHLVFPDAYECNCSCGPPQGELCTSTVSVYSDSACMHLLGSALVSSDQDGVCINAAPGSSFGSKSATPPLYQSGTCTPSLTKSLANTLCCLP